MKQIRIIYITCIFLLSFSFSLSAQLSEEQHADMIKQMDIFNSILKEVAIHYVDSINAENIVDAAIAELMMSLDPYCEYIRAEDVADFQFVTTGEYGGIGAIISMKDNEIIIREPYDGMPAALAGLIPGDRILMIDGESMEGKDTQYASDKLKGQPNTTLTLTIKRIGENKPREIKLERKRIHIDPITYYGTLDNNIGYISLSSFTVASAQAVKNALKDLVDNHHITSLIFDVRDNGGGVVEECLQMLNYFLPKGELLLSMKGKIKQYDKTYRSTQSPIEPDLPLVILTNGNSASASEIIAGTIQDLDRGVIVGNRTFGKGLVQTTRPLPYGGQIKLTTAKYYIPSGRSIQRINYSKRNKDESAGIIPDSLTSIYYTKNNRPVKDGGGILPDFIVEETNIPTMIVYLELQSVFFDFVTEWRAKNPSIASPSDFKLTDEIYNEFKEYVKSKEFTYDVQSERSLEALKKTMNLEGYMTLASAEYNALEKMLKPDLDRDLELHKDLISKYLALHIMRQYYYIKGQTMYELRNDNTLNKAIEILKEKDLYDKTLNK